MAKKNNATIKTDVIRIVNAHAEREKQIRKAREYSAKVRKAERNERIAIACLVGVIGLTFAICEYGQSKNVQAQEMETQTETETIITTNEHIRTIDAVLVDIDDNGNYIIRTEDGHEWEMQDAPEVWYTLEIYDNETEDVTDDVVVGLYE